MFLPGVLIAVLSSVGTNWLIRRRATEHTATAP
jgi:hypothetical protein